MDTKGTSGEDDDFIKSRFFCPTFYIGRSRGGMPGARPLWDPILSFLHTFLPKSAHVRGPRPPLWVHAPPTGNPGSATVLVFIPTMFVTLCW